MPEIWQKPICPIQAKILPHWYFLDNSLPDGQGVDFIPYLKTKLPGHPGDHGDCE